MKRDYKKIIITLLATFVGVGLLIWWAISQDNKNAPYKAPTNTAEIEPVGQVFENQGQTHIKVGENHPAYNSNPPTSGWHYVVPADWGVYEKALVDEQALHNLEHGGIWISYKDIDAETKANLENIAKANPGSVIMSPRDTNDAKIILSSWTRLEKLDSYDQVKILDFISRNKNKSPEPLAR